MTEDNHRMKSNLDVKWAGWGLLLPTAVNRTTSCRMMQEMEVNNTTSVVIAKMGKRIWSVVWSVVVSVLSATHHVLMMVLMVGLEVGSVLMVGHVVLVVVSSVVVTCIKWWQRPSITRSADPQISVLKWQRNVSAAVLYTYHFQPVHVVHTCVCGMDAVVGGQACSLQWSHRYVVSRCYIDWLDTSLWKRDDSGRGEGKGYCWWEEGSGS